MGSECIFVDDRDAGVIIRRMGARISGCASYCPTVADVGDLRTKNPSYIIHHTVKFSDAQHDGNVNDRDMTVAATNCHSIFVASLKQTIARLQASFSSRATPFDRSITRSLFTSSSFPDQRSRRPCQQSWRHPRCLQ